MVGLGTEPELGQAPCPQSHCKVTWGKEGKGREGAVQVALGCEPILLLAMRAQRLQVTILSSAVCDE